MLIGYNNDVDHRGKTFHIQTEDRGVNDDCIETQLFHGGAILDTKITSYTEHVAELEGKPRDKKIKSIMKASHRSLFKKLLAGKYDEMVGLEPVEKPTDEVEEITEQFQPGQDRVPQAAVAIEEEGLDALPEEEGGGHMGLSQLKNKLAGLKESASGAGAAKKEDSSGGTSTAVMDAPPEMEQRVIKDKAPVTAPMQSLEIPKTGTLAWRGCEEPDEDLSVTALVEEFLAS